MQRLFRLIRELIRNKHLSPKRLPLLCLSFFRFILTEPVRWYEVAVKENKAKKRILKQDPVFIIGHWRSGTNFFHNMLIQDPQLGYLNQYKVVSPDLFMTTESGLKPLIEKLIRKRRTKDVFHKNQAGMDMGAEIDISHLFHYFAVNPHLGHIFPKNADYYFDKYLFFETITSKEKTKWQRSYDLLIKKLDAFYEGRQIILKSPVNTARIKEILKMYPRARFIYLYRNPYDIFYSNLKLWSTILNTFSLQEISQQEIRHQVFRVYRKMMNHYRKDRELIPEVNLVEVRYEYFIRNPLDHLRQIYEQLEIGGFERARPYLEAFYNQHYRSPTPHHYRKADVEAIQKEWSTALKDHPYPDPLKKKETDTNPKETVTN